MKLVVCLFSFFLLSQSVATAQIQFKGQVLDQVTRKGLEKVEILNSSRHTTSQTDSKGDFVIKAKVGDVIVYHLSGYDGDTALVVDLKQIRRFLHPLSNTLNTVTISGQVNSKQQYANIYNKANPVLLTPGRGLRFYPSTFFGKEGKNARRLKKLIESDQVEKEIDKRFNAVTVTSLLPLKQPDLDAFLMLYRPDVKFVVNADADDFKFYLLEAYERFKALPQDQRTLPRLKSPM